MQVDLRDPESIQRCVDTVVATFGRIDILVNNASALWWQDIVDTPLKRYNLSTSTSKTHARVIVMYLYFQAVLSLVLAKPARVSRDEPSNQPCVCMPTERQRMPALRYLSGVYQAHTTEISGGECTLRDCPT